MSDSKPPANHADSGSTAVAVAPRSSLTDKSQSSEGAEGPVAAASGEEFPQESFPVVGIGASAGGLEALTQFVAALPQTSYAAFVIVTHQPSGQVTLLPDLLSKRTALPVVTVQEGVEVSAGVIYVAPSSDLTLDGMRLHLRARTGTSPHLPIDSFFRSLSSVGERAVAIVLSGTGSDGTRGAVEVSNAGGLVFAQDVASARYPEMPASVVASGCVHAVVAPEAMPRQLDDYFGQRPRSGWKPAGESDSAGLFRVLQVLRARTGQDFTAYKKSTVWRRIERRIKALGLTNAQEYARFIENNPEETETLFRELLISVTSFFRDPEIFEALALPLKEVLEFWDDERPFRAWVPACATGEEAYSLAIAVREITDTLDKRIPLQIFATDLDQPAIEIARAGRYPISIEAQVSPQRLARFFTKVRTGYRISKEIRESIVFAPQNVIKDPPFTKLDLLSCRNLLIYLEPEPQRRVIGLFCYALRVDGLLLLGSSESIAAFDDAFESVDKKNKVFRRRDTRALTPDFPGSPSAGSLPRAAVPRSNSLGAQASLASVAERVLLANLAPPSVLINERGDIAYFHGRTGAFLEPAAGEPVSNLFNMVRDGLRIELSSALRQAATRQDVVVRPGLKVQSNGGGIRVRLSVRRLSEPEIVRGMFLVTFEVEPALEARGEEDPKGVTPPHSARIGELELELSRTRDNLRATIEELETSNEELKSANEELQSTNEELQSANEELETSREEMQSLNEELQTVNSELEERNRALSQANDDMQNLLNSTDVATVFLDGKLAIKRFTTQARRVFSLIDTDIGRPISDLSPNLRYDDLVTDAREVLRSLVFREREILTKDGDWRLMRIMPYRTAENVIDGLVMTFIDIDHIKREQEAANSARHFAETLVEALPAGVAVLDADLRVITGNQALFRTFKTNVKRFVGEPIQAMADGLFDIPELIDSLRKLLAGGIELGNLEVPLSGPRFGSKQFVIRAHRMAVGQAAPMILLVIEEATVSRAPAP